MDVIEDVGKDIRIDVREDIPVDVCKDIREDILVDVCKDVREETHIDVCKDVREDIYVDVYYDLLVVTVKCTPTGQEDPVQEEFLPTSEGRSSPRSQAGTYWN